MALSSESIIAIIAVFVACPPTFYMIWRAWRRHTIVRNSRQQELPLLPLSNIPNLSTHFILRYTTTVHTTETHFRSSTSPTTLELPGIELTGPAELARHW
ncbi:hypothetical protein BS50DRAFT_570205 [Corynespora cassiicola Philippines]|uniref:Uncharacterized protein n=1 Tax=Corynespora cassiicola Philippines TaxID=1448308 RepID=A0A2T2NZH3_CORCC|nr:hypothetical protein BS50DRAFT_570205 [Corynespora cassiicola Philippines]